MCRRPGRRLWRRFTADHPTAAARVHLGHLAPVRRIGVRSPPVRGRSATLTGRPGGGEAEQRQAGDRQRDRRDHERAQQRSQQRGDHLGLLGRVLAEQVWHPEAEQQIDRRGGEGPGAGAPQDRRPVVGGQQRQQRGEGRHGGHHGDGGLEEGPDGAGVGHAVGGQGNEQRRRLGDDRVELGRRRHQVLPSHGRHRGQVDLARHVALAEEGRVRVGERRQDGGFDRGVGEQARGDLIDHGGLHRHLGRDQRAHRPGQVLRELGPDLVVVEQLLGDLAGPVGVEDGLEGHEARPRERAHEQREPEDGAAERPPDHVDVPKSASLRHISSTLLPANPPLVAPRQAFHIGREPN